MKKILIVRLSSLGDIIHTFPMLYDIKQNEPHCQIDWLVDENFREILTLNPHVDRIISLPLRKWKANKLSALVGFIKWKKLLSNKNYDYIIDVQGLVKSAIFTKLFVGTVYGLGKYSIKEKLATRFYNYSYETGREHYATIKNRILASKIFNYRIDIKNMCFGLDYQGAATDVPAKYTVFFHATSRASKKYGNSNWATLADYLIKEHGLTVILPYGNSEEKLDAENIKQRVGSANIVVCDKVLNYTAMTNLIINAQFIFGVDTGFIHLANALNKKLIAIFTDSDPAKTGVFESAVAKNIGSLDNTPLASDIIDLFEKLNK